ncbi:MAG: hypothetical protein R3228_05820, partial [Halioglobus sp.]|nr:hypothetical protein [Halioglobus sp.]
MKTFDLTFEGKALKGHSIGQVKINLARLFCIADDEVVNKLFSGKTILLRCDLDRKTAAGYFRELTEMGAEAALTPSAERLKASEDVLVLKQERGQQPTLEKPVSDASGPAMAAPSGSDQIWAVRSTAPVSSREDGSAEPGRRVKAAEDTSKACP